MKARVREAQIIDAEAIAVVHSTSWRTAYRELLPERYLTKLTVPHLTRRWHRTLQRRRSITSELELSASEDFLVLELGGAVVGFCEYGPVGDDEDQEEDDLAGFAGEVHMVYLHPTTWGQGLGRPLMDAAMQGLERRGLHWAVVWVLEQNTRARRFYERLSFAADGGRRHDLLGGEMQRLVRYGRAINAVPLQTSD